MLQRMFLTWLMKNEIHHSPFANVSNAIIYGDPTGGVKKPNIYIINSSLHSSSQNLEYCWRVPSLWNKPLGMFDMTDIKEQQNDSHTQTARQ